jgi:hypothetical protein
MLPRGLRGIFHAPRSDRPRAGSAPWILAISLCIAAVGAACGPLGDGQPGDEPLGRASEAIDVCNETVPSNRYVDGFPAYAQCDATTGSIWSNNGIDTATSSQGSDWVRTQQGGGYQCTEWAWRYMHFRWNVDYRHGDARQWCDGTLPSTLVKSTVPVHGDLVVFDGGVCGADATTGHIAVIDSVDTAASKLTIVEENRAGRRATDQSCALCFLHATANDGSAPAGAGGMHAGSAGAGAGAGSPGGGATGRGGAPSFGGATANGGQDSRGNGGAFSTAGRGAGGFAQAGSGGSAANDGGRGSMNRGGAANSGAPNAAAGRGESSGSDFGGTGGTSAGAGAGSSSGAGGFPSASAGATSAGPGAEPSASDADSPPDAASGGCQLGMRAPHGVAGWMFALSCWVFTRKRRFAGQRLAA